MLLYDIFLSLYEHPLSSSLQGLVISAAEFELERQKAVARYRCLNHPEKVVFYRYLLEYFQRNMQGQHTMHVLPLMLNALADDDAPIDSSRACDMLTTLYYLNTKTQDNALNFAAMGKAFIDRPRAFAAFLRCLCRHGLSVSQILSTYLLHDYFRYHVSTLGAAHHPIAQLYQLLDAFSETMPLVALAKTRRSDERGFWAFALDGSVGDDMRPLGVVERKNDPLFFSTESGILNGLYAMFGGDFLLAALEQCEVHADNAVWSEFMINAFNAVDVIETQLPLILSRIHEHAHLQHYLATILTEKTLEMLVVRKRVNVLGLILFRPELIDLIQCHDLVHYLHRMRQITSSGLALIIGLGRLLEALNLANEKASEVVFEHLMDAVLGEPYVLEDSKILRMIRKFPNANDLIVRKVRCLEKELEVMINMQTQGSIAVMDYLVIEDTWRNARSKIQLLQEMATVETAYPHDKYQLHVRLATVFLLNKPQQSFDLHVFADAIGVDSAFSPKQVTMFERLVVELLAAIDLQPFRQQCIVLLDEQVTHRAWRIFPYGDTSLYRRASAAGNLGLIRWLEAEKIPPHMTHDAMAIGAARANHWSVVKHIHEHYALKCVTVNILLHMAVNQSVASVIPMLWNDHDRQPTLNQVEQTFMLAVRKNDANAIRYIINNLKAPSDAIMLKGFKYALKLNYHDSLAAIDAFRQKPLISSPMQSQLMQLGLFSSSAKTTMTTLAKPLLHRQLS